MPERKPRAIDWAKYPIRKCYALHGCRICGKDITLYQNYYDGGYGRRAHVKCVESKAEVAQS